MVSTEELKKLILSGREEGKVVYRISNNGLVSQPVDELCDQPADGILYDLNRDDMSILTFAGEDNPYWVNNMATATVIRYLRGRIEKLEKEDALNKAKIEVLSERLDEAIQRICKYE